MIKVVIFDAIGLLTHQEALSKGLARDYNIPLEKSLPFFEGGPLRECVAGKADVKEVIAPFLEEWGWNGGVEELLKYWFERDHKINTELVSYIKSLRNNKKIQCVLATNNEKYRFAYMLDKMSFAEIFDKTYCSAHLGHKKPNQEFYQKIFKDLGNIKKEEILFWDDKIENVKGAKDFGIHAEIYITFDNFGKVMKRYLAE